MGGSYSSSSPGNSPKEAKKKKTNFKTNLQITGDFTSEYNRNLQKANGKNYTVDDERLKVIFFFSKYLRPL